MDVERPVALSLFPEIRAPRAVDYIVESVQFGHNGDVLAAFAPLYLTGSVLDVTYGRGMWWTKFTPETLTYHDIALDGVDFRALPEADNSFDTVCFDPPYISRVSNKSTLAINGKEFAARFGLTPVGDRELWEMIAEGVAEVARVARQWVLIKCCDYTVPRGLLLGHHRMIELAELNGMRLHDLIVHASGTGPGGERIFEVKRARRAHSYLLVFKAPK